MNCNLLNIKRNQAILSRHLNNVTRLQNLLEKEERAIFDCLKKERQFQGPLSINFNQK